MIRITGGAARGRSLKVYQHGSVRPTTDKVRQAIFNILEHRYALNLSEVSALDLFAGSGSLGLELLSRGGSEVTFVELDRRAVTTLRDNVKLVTESLKRDTRAVASVVNARVIAQRVERFLKTSPTQPVELVFADPPYQDERGARLLEQLSQGWVNEESLVLIEHAKRDLFEPPPMWAIDDRRSYGDTLVSFLRYTHTSGEVEVSLEETQRDVTGDSRDLT